MDKIIKIVFMVIIISYLKGCNAQLNQNLTNFMKTRIEKYAIDLVAKMEESWSSLCSYECSSCSYDGCALPLPLGCYERWTQLACKYCGSMRNLTYTDLRIGNRFYDINTEDPEVKETICAGVKIEGLLKEIVMNETMIVRGYFGDYMGVLRNFPAEPMCGNFDDRYRPWYVAASTGVKDILLIIDTSENTNEENLNITKTVANFILSTLTFNDYAAMVTIGNDDRLFSPYLMRADSANVGYMSNFINSLSINNTSNYEFTFKTVYDIIDRSLDTNRTSNCQQIIFMVSAGPPKSGETNTTKLLNLIKSYNESIFYFTYSIGDVEDPFLKALACEMNGVHEKINVTDYYPSITSYFQVLETFITESKIAYAEPYTDTLGSGYMTTASMAVYDKSQNPPFLIGVWAFDILMSSLLNLGRIDQVYVAFQEIGSAACSKSTLTPCQVESIRPDAYKCGVTDTTCKPYQKTIRKCPNKTFPGPSICNSNKQKKVDVCCDHDICSVTYIYALSIIFGFIGLVGLILLCLYFCFRTIWNLMIEKCFGQKKKKIESVDISKRSERSENIEVRFAINNYLGVSKSIYLQDVEK